MSSILCKAILITIRYLYTYNSNTLHNWSASLYLRGSLFISAENLLNYVKEYAYNSNTLHNRSPSH